MAYMYQYKACLCQINRSSLFDAVDHRFESPSVQTKDYKIGICCFSDKQVALRRKSIDWLARNQDNMSE